MDRNILFLCTGNSSRSPIAEAILKQKAGDVFNVYSAGTAPREKMFEPAIEVMKEVDLDISEHTPVGVKEYLGKVHFEKAIILSHTAEENCPRIFGPADRVYWPFDDPAGKEGSTEDVLAFTRAYRDEVERKISEWLNEIGVKERAVAQAAEA